MMEMKPELFKQAENHVRILLEENLPQASFFHNIDHTVQVVEQCQLLASYTILPEIDTHTLLISAWFHDTGYSKGSDNHEEESVRIAFDFLTKRNVTSEFLAKVQKLILSTKVTARTSSLAEEIIRDADMHHLGSPHYETWSRRLKKELEHLHGIKKSDIEWTKQNIAFFKSHHYHTRIAKTLWERQKQKNLFRLLDSTKVTAENYNQGVAVGLMPKFN